LRRKSNKLYFNQSISEHLTYERVRSNKLEWSSVDNWIKIKVLNNQEEREENGLPLGFSLILYWTKRDKDVIYDKNSMDKWVLIRAFVSVI
jgi:hypothetical protein